jgi:hypothetical protein
VSVVEIVPLYSVRLALKAGEFNMNNDDVGLDRSLNALPRGPESK